MLHELRIENLLLIERAELRLSQGLNVITGETGAGKTVLAHSLDLLTGGRARPQIVRPGAAEAYVEGVFDLPSGLLDDPELAHLAERLPREGGEMVLARRVGTSGRTSAFVQGRAATAADLKALGSRLLAFHGQHEHRLLTLESAQTAILDGFAGPDHVKAVAAHRRSHQTLTALRSELDETQARAGARERELDLLRFEVDEIEAVGPDVEEERGLGEERMRLRHAESLRDAAAAAVAALSGETGEGAAAAIAEAAAGLEGAAGADRSLDALAARARSLALEADDLASELRRYLDGVEAAPGRLQEVEERLAAVERLCRKHGGDVESVLAHAERCRALIAELEESGERTASLEHEVAGAEGERATLAVRVGEGRARAARLLEKRAPAELAEVALDGATLQVRLEPHPEGHGPLGAERIEMRISTNAGIAPSPLRDAASGGELSRVMLALRALAVDGDGARVLVFDEIDAGVGGRTGRAVGERLRALGDGGQVLCITHLPQVASLAEAHFRIEKDVAASPARASVERVEGEALVEEIVRMLGAEAGDETAERHARELLAA